VQSRRRLYATPAALGSQVAKCPDIATMPIRDGVIIGTRLFKEASDAILLDASLNAVPRSGVR
jgi:hypothetical protein